MQTFPGPGKVGTREYLRQWPRPVRSARISGCPIFVLEQAHEHLIFVLEQAHEHLIIVIATP